ncbi:angiotensin-converting enzyme-like isoform X2 [Pseudomyrmex gracilis]|nr:angiotensin-converting enzyme-like isoform X2 [Pseudomyrmex gracilis]XP_020295001.1 angiotensin-converting enzyme-like isoform X2 [Pseudomyrmex gracilis]XP_020295002.1 angiotensin-converting enzyme-like isoform X2 [Pseudomyrmex gracilis]XP_020295003.1 angiotensin-converting enzyme-like isoform X2 [Pseudomyrmex gracilis]
MLSKWSWIALNLVIVCVSTAPQSEPSQESSIKAFLHLIELEYEDTCYSTNNVHWSFITSPSDETLSIWELQQQNDAKSKKTYRHEINNTTKSTNNPSVNYKYSVIEKPGDALLQDEEWKKLVHFAGVVQLQKSSVGHVNKSHRHSREDVKKTLSSNEKPEVKQAAWKSWYQQLTPLVQNYSNNLLLVAKAAEENGAKSVEEYWEMLSGYPNAYEKINSEWSRINTVYKTIVKFIGANLAQKYKIIVNDTVPAYLLGSLQGYDWLDVSPDLLHTSELIYDIKRNLWKKKYVGRSLYKTASNLGSILFKQVPQAEFWERSEFNQTCPSTLLNFCQGIMRVSTCSVASVSNFVTAHSDIGKILFNQMTVERTPVLNIVNRYSGLEESVSTLFGILSASPAWLNYTHLMNSTNDNEQRMIASLMITGLYVLPRLAYYYAADLWRLNAIAKNITDPTDLVSSWWNFRNKYEGVSSDDTDIPTFLDDSYIVSNKPYLSKILGTILAFQLYEYTLESNEVRYDSINGKLIQANIIKMIQHGGDQNWPDVLNKYVDIDDIDATALISYFWPLEEFIEEHEEDFEYKSGDAANDELEKLRKRILKEINTPTTTPAPTTTTKRTTTEATSSYKIKSNEKNMQSKVDKSLEAKSSVYTREDKPKTVGLPIQDSLDKSSPINDTSNVPDSTPKINTSKAVWAVSAILVAIVVICVIAIIGRRRCRRTPKNRRYV